jgi:HD-like signal output (HDOD) protein
MGGPSATSTNYREQILNTMDKLPPFSPILTRLLATLADEDVSFGELAALIEKDAVLAGNVLKLVNSPLYGHSATINSVHHAVSLVGLVKIRNVVLGLSVARTWARVRMPKGWSARHFNLHAVAVATLSDLLVLEVQTPYPEGAFVSGLLHDIGQLLVAIAVPEEFELLHSLYMQGGSKEECELKVLGVTHSEVSGAVLAKWNLPSPIQRAVAAHHRPEQADSGRFHLAHILKAADVYVNACGVTTVPSSQWADASLGNSEVSTKSLQDLGVTAKLPRLLETAVTEFESMRSFI